MIHLPFSADDQPYHLRLDQARNFVHYLSNKPLAGSSGIGVNPDFALARYNPDGSPDITFGVDGKVTTDFNNSTENGWAIALQTTDGKIVVAGESHLSFAIARYNSDGSLDTTFDGDGKVTTGFSDWGSGRSVAVQADGKILVAGFSDTIVNLDFALARYNNDGSLDITFDSDGKVITDINGGDDEIASITVQPDGKIVVAGNSVNGSNRDFALARYNEDGSLDGTFDHDGKVVTDISNGDEPGSDIAIQSNGKILVTGYSHNGSNFDFVLVRYNIDGSLDTTFDSDGIVTTDIGGSDDYAEGLVIQPDGKIVVAGINFSGVSHDFALARYFGDEIPRVASSFESIPLSLPDGWLEGYAGIFGARMPAICMPSEKATMQMDMENLCSITMMAANGQKPLPRYPRDGMKAFSQVYGVLVLMIYS